MRRKKINYQFAFYILQFAFCIILLPFLSACGQHESSPAISPNDIQVTFKVLEAPVTGMTATLLISGMTGANSDGSYPMTVNTDGSVTASVSGVPAGTHTFTITYYDPSGLIIAQATTSGNVTAGANTTISVSSSQVSTAFDADNDGFTNLVEVNSGTNPNDPASQPTTFTLTVAKTGTGFGVTTSSPAGITCRTTCSSSFTSGTAVTLTATADSGSTFAGWSGGGCTGTGTCTVTMTADTSVTATFNTTSPGTFALTVIKEGTGSGTVTSSPIGIDCGTDCTEAYTSGTSVTLTATPDAGSVFSGWSGGGCTGTGTCIGTMDAATTVTATFNTSLTDIIAIAGGYYHTIALKSDGTVWAWGYNGNGALGNGITTSSSIPVQVGGATPITGVIAIAAGGGDYTIALKSDGTVWAWGSNGFGQLGNGTTANSSIPVQVIGAGWVGFLKAMNNGISGDSGQVASNNDDRSSFFGCGTIDIKGGGSSGPSAPGGPATILALLTLPFILRLWRRRMRLLRP